MRIAPASAKSPSLNGSRSVSIRPPTRGRASSCCGSCPARCSSEAATSPAIPAPTITTRAGVERATVYRHFPDERTLLAACTGHYVAQHPRPDPAPWGEIADPKARLRTGLAEVYAYHRRTERMTDRASRDLADAPVLREVLAPEFAYGAGVRDALVAAWPVSEGRRALVVAAVGHAVAFSTWRSLVRDQGLDETQAIVAMVAMVRGLAADG